MTADQPRLGTTTTTAGTAATAARRFAALTPDRRRALLRRLVELDRIDQVPHVVPPREPDAPITLSPAQRDLWVFESLYPEDAALNLCCSYHFDTPVRAEDLETALTILLQHHDILRTRVTGTAPDLRVEVPPVERFRLERQDLRADGIPLDQALHTFSRRAFDLAGRALIRGRLITVDDARTVLVLGLHHIITDWWSFDVLHLEFVETYQRVRDGLPQRLRRPELQYADFAAWQRELETTGVFDAQLAFWRDYLADPPGSLSVGPVEPDPDGVGVEQIGFDLDPGLAQRVRAFARRQNVTTYGVLMSAFAVLANRLSGQDDLLFGTPIANRATKGLERMIGYVMNTVPMRFTLGPDATFLDLVGAFAAGFPLILANGDVPLGRIVKMMDPERLPHRSPLFQWVFMYLGKQESVQALQQIARPMRVHTGGEHDVVGILRETETGISGSIEIRTDLYAPEVVRHWADAYVALVDGLTAHPDTPVRAIPCAPGLIDLPPEPEPATASLAELVARQASVTPDAPALESGDAAFTYAALNEQVEALARRLVRHGVEPESLVALALGRSAATVIAALATARAAGAFVPLDPDRPAELILRLLADAGPVVLVTDSATAERLPRHDVPLLLIDLDEPAHDVALPQRPADPRAAAYVTYTSGSTGQPKGVVTPHAGIAALAESWVRRLGLRPHERVLQAGSPSFDIWVGEICAAFGAGATLVVPESSGPLAGPELARVMAATRVTFTLIPPALLAGIHPDHCPDLATICSGADACPAELVEVWSRAGRRFFNAYGPTESTVAATVSALLADGRSAPPIGHTLLGTRTYVLDERLQPLPVGAPGELYLGGGNLARGYLRRPALTAERFVADPFAPEPGARMYRTGDLVRRRADGQLDFLGRTDRQVKLRGLRVEPGEIEAALAAHESVAEAAVELRTDHLGTKHLVAYLVRRPGTPFAAQAVLAHAARALPQYMLPTAVVELDRMPLTSRGKLDRAALPAPEHADVTADSAESGREPSTPREKLLCDLFAEVLGSATVGADSDFFALGGDSIMAIQLAARARAAGLAMRPAEVLTSRTPAALASLVLEAGPEAAPRGTADDELATATRLALPPTMRWWLRNAPSRDRFTMSVLFTVPEAVDEARISEALATLTRRHGALRLRLVPADADGCGWAWEMAAASDTPRPELVRIDAAHLDDAAIREAARTVAAEASLPPEEARMLTAAWFDTGDSGRTARLLLTVHHMAVDAVSWRVIEPELRELLATGTLTAPKPAASLRHWVEELDRRAADAMAELEVWRRALGDEGDQLAPGRPIRGPRGTFTVSLDTRCTETLVDRLPAAFRCSPEDVLLTALHAAALRWRGGGGTRLSIELEGHGRSAPSSELDLSATVGWFTCQYPVLLDAAAYRDDAAPAARALKQIKDQLRAVPDNGLGYGLLRHRGDHAASEPPALSGPQLRFNFLGKIGTSGNTSGIEMIGVADQDAMPLTHLVELDAACIPGPDGLVLTATWSYAAGTLTGTEIRDLAEAWTQALAELAGYADDAGFGGSTVADFPLVALTQGDLESFEADLEDEDGSI